MSDYQVASIADVLAFFEGANPDKLKCVSVPLEELRALVKEHTEYKAGVGEILQHKAKFGPNVRITFERVPPPQDRGESRE